MIKKIVITGGHHTSALPVISALRQENPEVEIFWFGHHHTLKGNTSKTLEYQDITGLGITFYNLHAGKLYKTYNITSLLKVPFGFFHALYLLLKTRPQVVLSFGGYLAAPTVLAAWLLRIPAFTHEQTMVAGYANRFISRFCKKIFISWEVSKNFFPSKKVVLTGLPLRSSLKAVQTDIFDLNPDLKTVYITAGKTGSHKINTVAKDLLPELLAKYNVIHQCGDHSVLKDFEALTHAYESLVNPLGKYSLKKYVSNDEIGEAFSKADVIVCRAGAHTVAELLYLEKPAVLVPIPWVSHNEQFVNASKVVEAGLGVILEEKNLTSPNLLDKIDTIVKRHAEYKLSADFSSSVFSLDSASIILSTIKSYV